jgi:hypothetical protein
VSPVCRSGCLPLPRSEPRFSGRTPRSLFVVSPTLTRLQLCNYFTTMRETSSTLHTCTKSNIHRIFKISHQEKTLCFVSRSMFHILYNMSAVYIGAYLRTKFELFSLIDSQTSSVQYGTGACYVINKLYSFLFAYALTEIIICFRNTIHFNVFLLFVPRFSRRGGTKQSRYT